MDNFWTYHTIFLLVGFTLFPRFSLLFCNIPGSLLFWIGWIILPRIVIAVNATIYYLDSNPILVILSWIIALGGESAEKKYSYKIKEDNFNSSRNIKHELIDEEL